jgi:hypothetical protein
MSYKIEEDWGQFISTDDSPQESYSSIDVKSRNYHNFKHINEYNNKYRNDYHNYCSIKHNSSQNQMRSDKIQINYQEMIYHHPGRFLVFGAINAVNYVLELFS